MFLELGHDFGSGQGYPFQKGDFRSVVDEIGDPLRLETHEPVSKHFERFIAKFQTLRSDGVSAYMVRFVGHNSGDGVQPDIHGEDRVEIDAKIIGVGVVGHRHEVNVQLLEGGRRRQIFPGHFYGFFSYRGLALAHQAEEESEFLFTLSYVFYICYKLSAVLRKSAVIFLSRESGSQASFGLFFRHLKLAEHMPQG